MNLLRRKSWKRCGNWKRSRTKSCASRRNWSRWTSTTRTSKSWRSSLSPRRRKAASWEVPVLLSDYGANLAKQNEVNVKKKLQKIKMPDSSSSEDEDDGDGENVRYFLQVIGMESYFNAFKENKILTLPKIRGTPLASQPWRKRRSRPWTSPWRTTLKSSKSSETWASDLATLNSAVTPAPTVICIPIWFP